VNEIVLSIAVVAQSLTLVIALLTLIAVLWLYRKTEADDAAIILMMRRFEQKVDRLEKRY